VVDLAVALEALFARTTSEITNRAATRAALLIGRDQSESERIYKSVEALYNLRSAIVHADPERRANGTKSVIRAWRGSAFKLPATARGRGYEAAGVGLELVARALRAFLRLGAIDELDAFGRKQGKKSDFVKQLDLLAFDSKARRKLQKQAGVISGTIR
jgi:hypothetical protein